MPYPRAKSPAASSQGKLNPDVAIPADAEDTISAVSWSPVAQYLATASWDHKVRIYDVAATGSSKGVALFQGDGPIFDCDWSKVRPSYLLNEDAYPVDCQGSI
jgi:mRNA export factor